MFMQMSRNTFKMQFKSSVDNMKRFLFLVFFAELIYFYFRNLIFKREETGNLLRNKLAWYNNGKFLSIFSVNYSWPRSLKIRDTNRKIHRKKDLKNGFSTHETIYKLKG